MVSTREVSLVDCKWLGEILESSPLVGSVLKLLKICWCVYVCSMIFTVQIVGADSHVARNRSVYERLTGKDCVGSGDP